MTHSIGECDHEYFLRENTIQWLITPIGTGGEVERSILGSYTIRGQAYAKKVEFHMFHLNLALSGSGQSDTDGVLSVFVDFIHSLVQLAAGDDCPIPVFSGRVTDL
jgi:hypothetical protein